MSADQIIDAWVQDRQRCASTFTTDPANVFPRTLDCMSGCGRYGKGYSTPGSCKGCSQLSSLRRDGDIVPVLTIEGGTKYVGTTYTIAHSPAPFVKYTEASANGTRYLVQVPGTVGHEFVVSSIIESDMRRQSMSPLPSARWMYSCNGSTMIVNENVVPLDLTEWKPVEFLVQLLTQCDYLDRFHYAHGSPSLAHLGMTTKPIKYTHKGMNIMCKQGIVIRPGSCTALSIADAKGGVIRFIGSMNQCGLAPDIQLNSTAGLCTLPARTYELRVRPQGLRVKGIDFYAFMIAVMTHASFRERFIADPITAKFWNSMWHTEDLATVTLGVERVSGNNYRSIMDLLSGIPLRSNITKEGIEYLQTIKV